jgi:hypothetical protein
MILKGTSDAEIADAWGRSQRITDIHEGDLQHALEREVRRFWASIADKVASGEVFNLDAELNAHKAKLQLIFDRHMTDTAQSFAGTIFNDAEVEPGAEWESLGLPLIVFAGVAADRFAAWTGKRYGKVMKERDQTRRMRLLGLERGREATRRAANSAAAEVHTASQRATITAGEFTGKVQRKAWMSRLDGKERPSHHHAHKQTVAIGDTFLVGGEPTRFPGDPRTSFGNWINCRCGTALLLE